MRGGRSGVVSLLFIAVACGGSKPAETSAAGAPSSSAASAPSSAAPATNASAPATASAAPSASASASGASGQVHEDADECGVAGAAYEKSVRPALKECSRAGKKTNPNLVGKARLVMTVDPSGKVASTKSVDKSELGEKVIACMLQALKASPFDGAQCKGKTVTIPIEFPTR
jgi:hypothetical protein